MTSMNGFPRDHGALLTATGLAFGWNRRSVFENVSFVLGPGQTAALRGTNGAGKTTLLKCLAGLLRPTAGEIFWRGEPRGGTSAERRQLAFVGHDCGLYPELTAYENLLFACRMQGVSRPQVRSAELLEQTRLTAWRDRTAGQLSCGIRRRLSLARALVAEPIVMLLDEPFTGLDESSAAWLEWLLGDLREQGRAICFSCHETARAERIADESWWLDDRRLRCESHVRTGHADQRRRAAA